MAGWRAFRSLAAGEPRLRAVSQTAYQQWWLLRFENAREELVTSRGLPGGYREKARAEWKSFALRASEKAVAIICVGVGGVVGTFVSRLSHVLLGTVEGTHA